MTDLALELLEYLVVVAVFHAALEVSERLGITLDRSFRHAHFLDELGDCEPLLDAPVLAVHADGVGLTYHGAGLQSGTVSRNPIRCQDPCRGSTIIGSWTRGSAPGLLVDAVTGA